ncbi:MAG: hypothetical protein WD534_12170 [Phycisphaeraceae bacterium]
MNQSPNRHAAPDRASDLPSDTAYVRVDEAGHFILDGQRVRFWGAIGNFPLDADYTSLEMLAERLADLGFNMVRFWRANPTGESYEKGDGSALDRADYFLSLLKARGLRAWAAGCGTRLPEATAADADIIDEPATRQAWREAVAEGLAVRKHPALIWDPRLEAIYLRAFTHSACHVNQHTGLRWADDPVFCIWELSNEEWWFRRMMGGAFLRTPQFFQDQLLARWNAFLREKYGDEAALKRAWLGLLPGESLEQGTVMLLPLRGKVSVTPPDAHAYHGDLRAEASEFGPSDFNRQRGGDVIAFLTGLWVAHKQRLHDHVKTLGKSVRLSPLVWDTGIGYEMQSQWLQQQAEAVAHDTYITGFHHDRTHKRFPWHSGLEELPRMAWDKPWIEQNKVDGKPYLVYETQMEQPSKYRAEFPMRIAALGAIQDFDAVMWHYYGVPPEPDDEQPFTRPMDYTISGGHVQGYHFQYDEVQLSAMKAASEIFRHSHLPPAPQPTVFRFGQQSFYNMDMVEYGELGWRFMPTVYRYGMRIVIDPDDASVPAEGRAEGPSNKPRVYEPSPIRPNDHITYDWQRGHLLLDAPGVASYTGFLAQYGEPTVRFQHNDLIIRDVTIRNDEGIAYPVSADEQYVAISAVAQQGASLAEAKRVLVSAMSTSFNDGFVLHEDKLQAEFGWWWNVGAVTAEGLGGLPVRFARVGVTIESPSLAGMHYTFYDWEMNRLDTGVVEQGRLVIPAEQPIFFTQLER